MSFIVKWNPLRISNTDGLDAKVSVSGCMEVLCFSIENVCALENNLARLIYEIEYDSIYTRKGEKVYSRWVDRIDNRQVVDRLCAVLISSFKGEVVTLK